VDEWRHLAAAQNKGVELARGKWDRNDGDALIVHKRRNLNPTQKIQLALADNRSAKNVKAL
jgi:hypothetical protein